MPLIIKKIEKNPFLIIDSKKFIVNNWRKAHKLPLIRKGSPIKIYKVKFENYTTKKQKKRYKRKHYFNLNDMLLDCLNSEEVKDYANFFGFYDSFYEEIEYDNKPIN